MRQLEPKSTLFPYTTLFRSGPLTVNEILDRAQRELAGLGVVTVYRTLKLLKESGQVRTVVLPSGEPRYEPARSEEHTSELQSQSKLVCRLQLEKKKKMNVKI